MFKDISYDLVNRLLKYNPDTGKLIWKTREVHKPQDQAWNTRWAGKAAGTAVDKDGYHVISINDELYRVNRIAYLLHNKQLDSKLLIDHIDQDKGNDKAINLRQVSYSVNNNNKKVKAKNINKHTAGWMVKVIRNKVKYSLYFKSSELALAEEFRDLLLEELDNDLLP